MSDRPPRAQVLARDHGVCALCGLDTELLGRVLAHLVDLWEQEPQPRPRHVVPPFAPESGTWCRPLARPRWDHDVLAALGFNQPTQALWECDHVLPVAERPAGEPPPGVEGYRTLCQPCHRAQTAALLRRLAGRQRCPRCGRPRRRSRLTRRPCTCAGRRRR